MNGEGLYASGYGQRYVFEKVHKTDDGRPLVGVGRTVFCVFMREPFIIVDDPVVDVIPRWTLVLTPSGVGWMFFDPSVDFKL